MSDSTNHPSFTRTFGPVPITDPAYAGEFIETVARLHHIGGNPTSHFSVTCSIGSRAQIRNGTGGGGAAHDLILGAHPELAPIVALHLSDEDGVPMHAAANARYWAGLTKWEEAQPEKLAKHLRITKEEAVSLNVLAIAELAEGLQDDGSITDEARAAADAVINAKVEEMKPIWKQQAEEAIAFLKEAS